MASKKILTVIIITLFSLVVVGTIFFVSQKKEEVLKPEFLSVEPTLQEKDVKLNIFLGRIEPTNFSVKPGERIRLSLTSIEGKHSIKFEDEKLSKVEGEFNQGETFVITFDAPQEKGEYKFFCQEPGHREKGEEGIMIVE